MTTETDANNNQLPSTDEYHSKKVSPPPTRSGVNYINVEDEDQMEIYGYTPNFAKTLLTWTLILLTGGLLRLLFHWKPHWMLLCTHNLCSLEYAKKVLLIDHFHQKFTETVVCLSNDRLSYHNAHGAAAAAADQQNTSTTSATAVGDDPEDQHWITVPRPYGVFEHVSSITYFENKKVRYIWDRNAKEFLKLGGLDREIKCTYFYQQKGLSAEHQRRRQVVYGLNQIVVTVQSVYGILISEVLEPFYIFQIFSLVIWSFDAYYYYASCIVIMSALSLTSSVIQTRRNQKQLRDTVQGTDSVMVYRGGEGGGGTGADNYEKVESSQLVPGDIIEVPSFGCIMQCDAVLISGNVIINEAMLTGESVPVTKTPLPSTTLHMLYDSKEHAKHTLFCGTKVIQTRYYNNVKVRAVIIRTGYQTAKGELVRSIMFPKPVDFKFNRHIHQFIGFLSFLALIGFVYTIILKAYRGVYLTQIMLKALDLITIIIPPALPAAMTIGVVFAQSRLRKAEIFCISPRSINISGCINCVCFDKTGTLTEDDLNFSEVVPVAETAAGLRLSAAVHHPVTGLEYGPLMISLAVCHSLTLIEGKIIGDPLDQKMFAATEWILEEPDVNDTTKYDLLAPTVVKPPTDSADKEVGILRQFPFSSSLQRMSVIARQVRGTQFELYAKGAPEMIQSLCDPRSLPADFSARLQEYTEKGYRVLGLAYRPLASMNYSKVQRAAREDLEKNLTFVGLLVMGNMLKPETTHVIETLLMANIRSVMVTGDNMLTALSVARECSMIQPWHKVILLEDGPGLGAAESEGEEAVPTIRWKFANSMAHIPDINFKLASAEDRDRIHIAVTGRTFKVLREHYPEVLKKVAVRGTVFARMAPEQKQQLIELLQELGYYVGMCGDGANDCGALKAAHAGVSLSETEASVASPFTSKQPNIGCIPTLIQEGRASIVTAFGILKYMACYSLTQFISVIILYTFYSNLTDKEFLYIDLFLITLFVTLFGRNKAFKQLNRNPPPSSLIGLTPLSSIVLQILLVLLMQAFVVDYLLFKKLKQWFAFLAPSHLPYEKIEGETRNNTLWLPNPPQNTPILERTTTSSLSTTTTSDASSNHSRLGPLGGDGSGSHVVLNGSAAHHRGPHQQQQRLDGGSDHLQQATSQFSIV
ncbi:PREDICTED: probable cation-transporting ATPase 13A3 [Rhagoletis zephyria]|uniref:probable cation-transporting ATPase 13A3 n=1 Tax=Rhagoletis zephyria TaxID=28612 RepID=UPI0008115710|nr:PREDICTED: probable cation-transporting ATPase 13A3 [Rhagoletis zephyria]